jgi:hypothetical protein
MSNALFQFNDFYYSNYLCNFTLFTQFTQNPCWRDRFNINYIFFHFLSPNNGCQLPLLSGRNFHKIIFFEKIFSQDY